MRSHKYDRIHHEWAITSLEHFILGYILTDSETYIFRDDSQNVNVGLNRNHLY